MRDFPTLAAFAQTPTPMRALARGLLLSAALLALAPGAVAQDPPIRWGDVSAAEVAVADVPGDPDAAAVILGDVGFDELEPSREGVRYTRRHHRRVKVLTEAGYEEGEFSFRYSKDDARVSRIRAQTFVPQPDGRMRTVELGRRDIYREEVRDGVEEVRFTMPALAPGVVFEYEYTYESDNAFVTPPAWYFQNGEPTVVSEYRVSIPAFLEYVTLRQGSADAHESRQGTRPFGRTTEVRWSARDVPALREEPYTTTYEDYTTSVKLQLSRIVYDGIPQNILTSWGDVAKSLDGNDYFGRRLATSRLRRAQVEGLTGTRDEKMRAVYDLVREFYSSNGRGGMFADRDLNDVIDAKSGSDPELTLLLAALLREAGVPVQLAVLSTRSNGRPVEVYPIVSQFDRVMVVAQREDGSSVFLDPTDRHRPFGVLPVAALNGRAWVAAPGAPRWIDVPPTTGTSTTSYVQGTLDEAGSLEGTVQIRLMGYDAESARDRMAESAADAPAQAAAQAETAADAADADDGVTIETVTVEGLDDIEAPLTMEATFQASAGEAIAGDLYLTPFVLMQLDENPFERTVRTFPVDFAYPFERTYVASITLPDGYAPDEVPAVLRLTTPSRAVSYTRVMAAEQGRLSVRAVLTVDRARIEPIEYPALRKLYDEIVAAEAEAVVLVRSEPPPAAPAAVGADETEAGAGLDGSEAGQGEGGP